MPTRRKFIRDCAFAAAITTLVPAALARDANEFLPPLAHSIGPSYEQFLSHVNTRFILQSGKESVELVLIEAKLLPPSMPDASDAGNEKFSLRFRSAASKPLEQGTYPLAHQYLGQLSIFIVPVGGTCSGRCDYHAIFNRPMNPVNLAVQLTQAPRRVSRNLQILT